jgi:hypothetical protein
MRESKQALLLSKSGGFVVGFYILRLVVGFDHIRLLMELGILVD